MYFKCYINRDIASDPSYYFRVSNFDGLNAILDTLLQASCVTLRPVVPTPAPAEGKHALSCTCHPTARCYHHTCPIYWQNLLQISGVMLTPVISTGSPSYIQWCYLYTCHIYWQTVLQIVLLPPQHLSYLLVDCSTYSGVTPTPVIATGRLLYRQWSYPHIYYTYCQTILKLQCYSHICHIYW